MYIYSYRLYNIPDTVPNMAYHQNTPLPKLVIGVPAYYLVRQAGRSTLSRSGQVRRSFWCDKAAGAVRASLTQPGTDLYYIFV